MNNKDVIILYITIVLAILLAFSLSSENKELKDKFGNMNKINPNKLYWATFNYFQFRLPGQCVLDCAHSGECYYDCKKWVDKIKKSIDRLYKNDLNNPWYPTQEKIKKELKEYGAWDDEELNNENENWIRLIWCAANDIMEDDKPDCSAPAKTSK